MIRLVSTDFDGTICDHEHPPLIAPGFLDWIHKAQKNGLLWAINTGRDEKSLMDELGRIAPDAHPDYLITHERYIFGRTGNAYEPVNEWNDFVRQTHDETGLRHRSRMERLLAHGLASWKMRAALDKSHFLCLVTGLAGENDFNSRLNSHNDTAEEIHAWLRKELDPHPELAIVRNGPIFRISLTAHSKGTTLGELARRLGINKSTIFAAGDNHNDLPMLDGTHAHMVATPVNAMPEVKTAVTRARGFVASRRCSLGILEALEYFSKSQPGFTSG